jgi:hypothetical protein
MKHSFSPKLKTKTPSFNRLRFFWGGENSRPYERIHLDVPGRIDRRIRKKRQHDLDASAPPLSNGWILGVTVMNDLHAQPTSGHFEVRLGHTSVTVECNSAAEAVRLARRLLCQEMPRLWDVIQTLDGSRFQVQQLR